MISFAPTSSLMSREFQSLSAPMRSFLISSVESGSFSLIIGRCHLSQSESSILLHCCRWSGRSCSVACVASICPTLIPYSWNFSAYRCMRTGCPMLASTYRSFSSGSSSHQNPTAHEDTRIMRIPLCMAIAISFTKRFTFSLLLKSVSDSVPIFTMVVVSINVFHKKIKSPAVAGDENDTSYSSTVRR